MRYIDRTAAGRELAREVRAALVHAGHDPADVLVLGLPRGGVPVAAEVADVLGAELDVWVARKVGAPGQAEIGVGAVSENGTVVVDEHLAALCAVDAAQLPEAVARELREVQARTARFRGGRPPPQVTGRLVVVVDDGVANGVTARAALTSLRAAGARPVWLAVPVGSQDGLQSCAPLCDRVLCSRVPAHFGAVGAHFQDFAQVDDTEVIALLAASRARGHGARSPHPG